MIDYGRLKRFRPSIVAVAITSLAVAVLVFGAGLIPAAWTVAGANPMGLLICSGAGILFGVVNTWEYQNTDKLQQLDVRTMGGSFLLSWPLVTVALYLSADHSRLVYLLLFVATVPLGWAVYETGL